MAKGGPTDFNYITPQEYLALGSSRHSLATLERRAQMPARRCSACGNLDAWKLAGTGMCFPCTTGESDASNDYELRSPHA